MSRAFFAGWASSAPPIAMTDPTNPPDVLLRPTFMADAAALFEHLVHDVEWDTRMKARKTASFGVAYDYSQITYPETDMPPRIDAVRRQVAAELGFAPNNCLLNFYEDGRSSMGFHSDSSEELVEGTGVAIVSLGSERSIVFRHKQDRSREYRYALPSGSLLFMSKAIQDLWLHAIPKAEGAGPRISMTFREIAVFR